VKRDGIAQAASTMFSFPQTFTSQYHMDVLSVDGPLTVENLSLAPKAKPLPVVLSEAGYEPGGFVASNPNVDVWSQYFDRWANQELERFPNASSIIYELDYYFHLLLQKPRVPASQIGSRAREWFEATDPPRFLWMHVMEPHSPYCPGLRAAADVGLFDAYRANRR